MNTRREAVDGLLARIAPQHPHFKRSHAYHVLAALHGLPNWQTLKARPRSTVVNGDALERALIQALEEYQIMLPEGELHDVAHEVRRTLTVPTALQQLAPTGLAWAGAPTQLWDFLLERANPDTTAADLVARLQDAHTVADEYLNARPESQQQGFGLRGAMRALRSRLLHPAEVMSPLELVARITSVTGQDAWGVVLHSPRWDVPDAAPFVEILLTIPAGYEAQKEQDFLTPTRPEGGVVRTRSVHAGRRAAVPVRQVGEIVRLPMQITGVLPPQWVDLTRC